MDAISSRQMGSQMNQFGNAGQMQVANVKKAADSAITDVLATRKGAEAEMSGALEKNFDRAKFSEELMDEMRNKPVPPNQDVKNILKQIAETKLSAKMNDIKKAKKAQKPGGPKKKRTKIEVTWKPLVKQGYRLRKGQPWGHFKITKTREDAPTKGGEAGGADAAAKGGKGGAASAAGAAGKGGGVGGVGGLNKNNGLNAADKVNSPNKNRGAQSPEKMGPNGKPKPKLVVNGQEKDASQLGKAKGGKGGAVDWKIDKDEKVYINDTGTGRKQEVPKDGVLREKDRNKNVHFVGSAGKLKGGQVLLKYTFAQNDNREFNPAVDGEKGDKKINRLDNIKKMERQRQMGGAMGVGKMRRPFEN